ncbi:hypothetical protein HPHPA11_0058 [Helicobacter pylori Hp A-11]|uniref:Uncharacterized protein n=1 Tax=Helicobacter pylori Hp A-11 TaxID=992035 RepID=N4TI56_HELPX|nr:hypothetical protein [Helicobacter pylori]ENH58932.1 hypothetical protein HPHPA11_0058 [Helicobacter pylori Hp A-11]
MAYTYNQNSEMSILARVFNTAVFSNNSAFDITPFDLGEEQMSVEMEDEVVISSHQDKINILSEDIERMEAELKVLHDQLVDLVAKQR